MPTKVALVVSLGALLCACTENHGARPLPSKPGAPQAARATSLTGTYEVDPVPQGKKLQGAWLVLEGGHRVVLSYRPFPEHFRYIGKRVVVRGAYPSMPPHIQSISARHFTVTSIALAPGETPHATAPARIPAPPLARSRAELERLEGKWVRVYGRAVTLEVSPHESRYALRLVVELPDGHRLQTSNHYLNLRWDKRDPRDTITVVGRATRAPMDGGTGASVGFSAVCQGHVERCGMD
jgi:hypothetical protein